MKDMKESRGIFDGINGIAKLAELERKRPPLLTDQMLAPLRYLCYSFVKNYHRHEK
jgi:hypothetical protein